MSDSPIDTLPPQTPDDGPPSIGHIGESPGDSIGPYKLRQLLGEGGMGSVWVAEQSQPVRRQVALKLIKAGMDSGRVLARFAAEKQALALMDHPNIAKVLDAGATQSGRPYFVMELVKGIPITTYCDQEKLTPRERLELFIPVCQAVQHAHQKGIIHRDLKPSNILVALYNGKPVPKVIDFGVAKATGSKLTEQSMYTEVGAIIGTLEYMAPEQAELNNLDIDTRADIYSLGVILYELLTGSPPFSRKHLQGGAFDEMLRMIREVEPSKPSTKVSSSQDLPTLAAVRKLEPKRLAKVMRGELDWIVMKCLEKERARRYETANGLAADIGRYLNDEPVLACPPSRSYRFRKFARRNKGGILAASLIFLAILGGIAGTTWGLIQARQERDAAQAREAETKAVLNFVQDKVFAAARPEKQDGGLGHDVTLRRAIETALPDVKRYFESQPLVEAQLRTTLGRSFKYLGDAKTACEQFQTAQDIYARLLGDEHPAALTAMSGLAQSYLQLGRHEEALALAEKVLALRKAKLGPDHPDTFNGMNDLANAYAELGRNAEALELDEKTFALRKAKLGFDHPGTLWSMNNLARSYADLGRHDEALVLDEETLRIRKARLGSDHPDTLTSMDNLARDYFASNRIVESCAQHEETFKRRKALLGADHPDTIETMISITKCWSHLGRHDDSIKLCDETLAICKAKSGPHHANTVKAMKGLAYSYSEAGRQIDAIELYEAALQIEKAKFGNSHAINYGTIYGIACCHALLVAKSQDQAKQADLAMDWLKQAVADGYKYVEHMKKDKDLDALREREDFKKLIVELEAKKSIEKK